MEKEKEGTADNEGLTDLILDEEAMIDLIERYEKDDDWNSYFFRLDEIVRNIITREMAQYKTSLLDRVEADVETIKALYPKNKYTTIGFKDFKAKVKSAISKIRGLDK